MEKLVLIDKYESAFIAGGRSEEMARFVETIAICIGVCSRLIYLFFNRGQRVIAAQAMDGRFQKF